MSFKETDFLGKLFPNIWIEHLKGKLGIFVASLNKIRLK